MICQQRGAAMPIKEDAFDTKNVRFHYAVSDASGNWKVVEDTQKNENKQAGDDCIVMVNDMDANDKAAAWNSGLWVAVEWTQDGIFDFDYLVAM
jgi:F420-0:gamma-glutamyl ligase-like protein